MLMYFDMKFISHDQKTRRNGEAMPGSSAIVRVNPYELHIKIHLHGVPILMVLKPSEFALKTSNL